MFLDTDLLRLRERERERRFDFFCNKKLNLKVLSLGKNHLRKSNLKIKRHHEVLYQYLKSIKKLLNFAAPP